MMYMWGVVVVTVAKAAAAKWRQRSAASTASVVMEPEMKLMVIAELLFFSPSNETSGLVACTEDDGVWAAQRTQKPNRRSPSRHQWHLRIQKTVLWAQTRLYCRLSLHGAACLPLQSLQRDQWGWCCWCHWARRQPPVSSAFAAFVFWWRWWWWWWGQQKCFIQLKLESEQIDIMHHHYFLVST